ncbi:hypothetical protein CL614_06370 [archaeon]|nr:hypothetical protein [archaeon]|tara:strand:+ start:2349 stop:2561 length:213 start_codon:yes stop_codon:yes gene_type:complete
MKKIEKIPVVDIGKKTEINECQNINIPMCCGKEMETSSRIGQFLTAKCGSCGDTVYIKCGRVKKPEMISD